MTLLVFALHIGGGAVGLVSGAIAVIVRKGGRLHRRAGTIFVVSMLVMAIFGCYLAVVVPDQLVNVFISVFASYLILTAWLAAKRADGTIGIPERVALAVGICLCAPFAILSFQLAMGLTPLFKSAVPFKGPVLIAIYSFTSVLVIAALGDAKVVFQGGISGVSRISRHLWRMCLGLTGRGFGVHQRIGAATSGSLPCADGVLLAPVHPFGVARLLVDPGAILEIELWKACRSMIFRR